MSKTIVGLFSSMEDAHRIQESLLEQGYSASNVKVMANDEMAGDRGTGTGLVDETKEVGEGIGQKISNFFHGLTGGDDDIHHHYASGINKGGALVAVTCDDDAASETAALLKQHGAQDIETAGDSMQRTAYGSTGTATGETAIPIVEEQLVVGKREVDRGGVRVYSHVVEKPASADVTLHEEKVLVERRPVNREATAADFNMGQGVVELKATGEEAVIGKTARVVEEVMVGKTGSEHTEVIRDSVRKTEVDVEQLPGSKTTTKDRY